MIRNTAVVLAAIIVGIVAMQPFVLLQAYFTAGRSFQGLGPELLLRALDILPVAVAAAGIGAVAAFGIRTDQPEKWAVGMAAVVGVLLVASFSYVAPQWSAWVAVAIQTVLPAAVTWIVFRTVWTHRHRAVG